MGDGRERLHLNGKYATLFPEMEFFYIGLLLFRQNLFLAIIGGTFLWIRRRHFIKRRQKRSSKI